MGGGGGGGRAGGGGGGGGGGDSRPPSPLSMLGVLASPQNEQLSETMDV